MLRSTSVTDRPARASLLTVANPPNPTPTTTTRGGSLPAWAFFRQLLAMSPSSRPHSYSGPENTDRAAEEDRRGSDLALARQPARRSARLLRAFRIARRSSSLMPPQTP